MSLSVSVSLTLCVSVALSHTHTHAHACMHTHTHTKHRDRGMSSTVANPRQQMCYPLNQGLSSLSSETFFSEVRKAVLKHPDSGWSPLWSRAHDTCLISQNSTHGVKRETQHQGAGSLLDVGSSPHELAGRRKLTSTCARECDTTGDWKGWGREYEWKAFPK